jgi:hypothetical protein
MYLWKAIGLKAGAFKALYNFIEKPLPRATSEKATSREFRMAIEIEHARRTHLYEEQG